MTKLAKVLTLCYVAFGDIVGCLAISADGVSSTDYLALISLTSANIILGMTIVLWDGGEVYD